MDFTKIKTNLENIGYTVSCFATSAEACKYLAEQINNTSVAIGGSMTVKEIGLAPILRRNNRVVWHLEPDEGKTVKEMLHDATNTEIYISSVNAIAESGEIVNIDGTCNRLAGTLYGHKKVYFIIGSNKIANDYEKALWRARNVASPLNARRLKKKTPCAVGELKCHNCNSPERICRSLNVFWTKPTGCEYEIVLVDETLGY